MKSLGQIAHDAWCADNDWDDLGIGERLAWEDVATAVQLAITGHLIRMAKGDGINEHWKG